MKFRWPLACATMPGAKPQNAPPASAMRRPASPGRARTTWRENTQYQANAVPDRLSVNAVARATGAPNSSVTGVSSSPMTVTPVFAATLTPSGAFIR